MRHRGLGLTALLAVALAAPGGSARGQWVFPPGYGGWYGWGGGQTAFGDAARGMGAFAAGAGAYNLQSSQARAINVDTNMRLNQYLWESQQVRNQQFYRQLAARQQRVNETAAQTANRLRNNPEPRDIRTGDALNVILDDLTDPRIYLQSLAGASQPIDAQVVKSIPFRYARQAITISLSELTRAGVPDVLRNNPALEAERTALRAAVDEAKAQIDAGDQVDPATLTRAQEATRALHDKVMQVVPAGRDRRQAENFLKALYGLTKMMQEPQVDTFLRGLDTVESTTLGHLLGFMQAFNLRFGPADGAAQRAAYTQLYPMLLALARQVNPEGSDPSTAELTTEDHAKAAEAFSGMEFEHFGPQPAVQADGAPAPAPAPGAPN